MVSLGLIKLGKKYGMQAGNGVVHGMLGGFPAVMKDGMGTKTLCLCLGSKKGAEKEEAVDIEALMSKPIKKYMITQFEVPEGTNDLLVVFYDTVGTLRRIRAFVENELPRFAAAGLADEFRCAQCGEIIEGAPSLELLEGTFPAALHANCVEPFERATEEEETRQKIERQDQKSFGRAIAGAIGALLGAVVGAIPWIAVYALGYVASVLGALIGLCAEYGHKLFGGRPGKGRVICVIVSVVIVVFFAQIAGEVIGLAQSIQSGELAEAWELEAGTLTIQDHLWPLVQALIQDPEMQTEFLRSLAQPYLFAALGLIILYGGRMRAGKRGGKVRATRL